MKAREILEIESPRDFMRSLGKRVLRPSDDYYVGISELPFDLAGAEFCPFRLHPGHAPEQCVPEQCDATYNLNSEIEDYFDFEPTVPDPLGHGVMYKTEEEENQIGDAVAAYLQPIYHGLRYGKASGTVRGVLGPRAWKLVYWPRHQQTPTVVGSDFKVAGREED
jgi:hypothetical protein